MKLSVLLMTTVAAAAFNNETCETVLITTPQGDVRINKSDYDADQAEGGAKQFKLASQKKQDDAPQTDPGAPGTEITAAVAQANASNLPVMAVKPADKKGGKVHVVGADGNPVEVEGIDKNGYADDGAAWAAIMAVQANAVKPQQGAEAQHTAT